MPTTKVNLCIALAALIVALLLAAPGVQATTRTVTNGNDSGAGSLRATIAGSASGDTIVFAASVTSIALTSGELAIAKSLTISGPGANPSTSSGQALLTVTRSTADGTPAFRIFNVTNGTVAISGLTISAGRCFGAGSGAANGGPGQGGGIRNAGTLTLNNCALTQNFAFGGPGFPISGVGEGGGIFNVGTLKVTGCTFEGNSAIGGSGINNGRGGAGEGGGLCNQGTATLTNSTLSNNSASSGQSSFGSSGDARGGGVSNRGTATLTNCTLSANIAISAPGSCGGAAFGGGLHQNFEGQGSPANLRNTIVAGNSIGSASLAVSPDVSGAVSSQGHNLIGRTDGSSGWIASDLTGTNAAPLNAQLGPLQNNGGSTRTMALLPGSPAIDVGDDAVTAAPLSLATDQRGAGFPRKLGAHVDIGAYERDAPSGSATLIVTTTDDHNDSVCGVVDCTLREATNTANAASGANTIGFKAGVTGTITLGTDGELLISDAVTVQGPGAPVLTVDGNNARRVFRIDAPGLAIALSGLTISRGKVIGGIAANGQGGGIHNNAKLTLSQCGLSGNTANGGNGTDGSSPNDGGPGGAGQGAGIYNGGTLTLNNCTLSGNTATGGNGGTAFSDPNFPSFNRGGVGGPGQGGGIFNGGTLTLNNCTLSGNRVFGGSGGFGSFDGEGGLGQGAGIYSSGTLTLTAGTVSGNTAAGGTGFNGAVPGQGGGVYHEGAGSHIVRNSLLAGNTATSLAGTGPDALGAFTSQGFNLIGKSDGSTGFTAASDQTGTSAAPLNPRLGALANNGGPTPTMALLIGSPALDKGKSFGLSTDQRSLRRPADASALSNASGDGSDIGAFELQGPFLSINDASKAEGNSLTSSMSFTVTLSPASTQTVTVNYATADATATAGSDYVAVPATTLTFAPGETTKTVAVTLKGDTTVETNETFFVNLAGATNAGLVDNQGIGTMLNDDGSTLRINDVSVPEGNSSTKSANFTVTLSPASAQSVTVKYATADVTARAGSDYVAKSGTLTFAAGVTTQPINITVGGDTTVEPNETFQVNLSSASGASIFDSQGMGTITNDDAASVTAASSIENDDTARVADESDEPSE